MDDFDWIVLQTLYHYKSVTHSADDLFISQSALSRRLQQIEKEFGFQIASRRANGLIFTAEGENLAIAAKEYTQWLNQLKISISKKRQEKSVQIGCGPYFEHTFLVPVEYSFRCLYPDIQMNIVSGKSDALVKRVIAREINIAFVRRADNFSGIKK